MNTKVMIVLYRFRIAVSKGETADEALVHAIESVAENFFEYASIYDQAKALI